MNRIANPQNSNFSGFAKIGEGSGTTTFTLPNTGTWILITTHNATESLNTLWVYRTSSGTGFLLGSGNGSTSRFSLSGSGTTITLTNSGSGTAAVYAIRLGSL